MEPGPTCLWWPQIPQCHQMLAWALNPSSSQSIEPWSLQYPSLAYGHFAFNLSSYSLANPAGSSSVLADIHMYQTDTHTPWSLQSHHHRHMGLQPLVRPQELSLRHQRTLLHTVQRFWPMKIAQNGVWWEAVTDCAGQVQVQCNSPTAKMRDCVDTSWHSVKILMYFEGYQFHFGIFMSLSVGFWDFPLKTSSWKGMSVC